jgi:hypothetical protein
MQEGAKRVPREFPHGSSHALVRAVTTAPATKKNSPTRLRRWAKRIAIGFAIFWIVVVAGSNVFLKTSLFKDLMAFDPQAMTMEYSSAYSWFPCRVHAENLTVRGSDSHVQWLLTVDHLDTFIWPWEFAKQRIHASHVHANGVSFVVRTRFAPGEITPDLLTSLPRIPGFSDPPLTIPIPPPPSDADYNLWSANLEEVTADHVREVWVDTVRATGDIRITGRWFFRPLRELDFGPSNIEINKVDVNDGNLPLARGIDGNVELRIFPFDVRVPQGLDMLDQFSGRVKLVAEVPLSDALDQLLGSKTAHLSDGYMTLRTDVRLDHGVLSSGSHADADISETKFRASMGDTKIAVRSSAVANFDIDESRTLVGRARTGGFVFSKSGAPTATADLQVEMTSRNLRLAHGFDDASFRIHATDVRTQSIERWIAPDDKDSAWATGAVTAQADLDIGGNPQHVRGNIYFAVTDATIARNSLRITTDLTGEAKIEDGSIDDQKIDATIDFETPQPIVTKLGSLHMTSRIAAHLRVKGQAKPSMRVDVSGSEVHWRDVLADIDANQTVRLFSAPELTVRAPKAIIADSNMSGTIDVDLPRADAGDLSSLGILLPLPDTVKLAGGAANANAHATLDLGTLSGHGEMNLLATRLDVRIDKTQVYGNLALQLRAVRGANGVTDASGSTLTFARADAPNGVHADPWSAKFEMQHATLVVSPNPYFSAALRGEATDASPATMFVSGATGIPNWLTNAFRMRGLQVTAGILVAPLRLEVQGLDARGDNAFVQFEYSRMGVQKDGAMYVGAGPFGGSVDLAGGSARLVVFGAETWFKQDVAKIRRNELGPVVTE